ncbi:sulfatase [Aggregatimonas sangjinii]|uniref:Sulfatase n=1 Tax=Aggregatimonas sangjinii TaxID=2583587 RepID=A0A5B7SST8_9FLAO|nr:sulfatase [Aggregatimonas sangjinii]QCW99723.1 sulfatase [Aggregatimonas sangjinii]
MISGFLTSIKTTISDNVKSLIPSIPLLGSNDNKILQYFVLSIAILSSHLTTSQEIKPNVVIINVDDMGWKDVGFMGSSYYETPNIDYLASLGMVFTNGYAAAANCAPSRASLMTGKWTPRHGIYTVNSSERGASKHRKLIPVENTVILSKKHKVLPELLHQKGYNTCHAGKWHLSKNPLEYGFEVNIGGGFNGLPKSYYPPYENVNIKGGENKHLTDLIMEKTLSFVDTVQQPFFLYYAPYAVHTPIQPIDSLLEKYTRKPSWEGQGNPAYATMVENLDRNIGLLISKIKEKGLFNNTLIIFTSDNGGLYGITKQLPLRAGKGSYYEGGIREPFFFVMNDRIKANSKSDIPITHLDLFPTILNFTGIDSNQIDLDGTDLSQILEKKANELKRPLYWHFPIYLQAYNVRDNENRDSLFRTRPGSAIRYENWKLHYYFENNEVELYDLAQDIGEGSNLALQNPEKTTEMLGYLQKWWDETNAPIPKQLNPAYED